MKGWFCGGSSPDRSSNVNAERSENWILEIAAGQPKARRVLKARPGLRGMVTAGPGPHRAAFQQNGRCFVVSGTGFYEITYDGMTLTATLRNSGTPLAYVDGRPATLHGNGSDGDQILIISGGLGYLFTLSTNTFAQITDPDFPTDVLMGGYLRKSFIVIQRNARVFGISAEDDGASWDALDLASKSNTNDNLVGLVVDQDSSEVWLIGNESSEVWWFSGAAAFPLEPVPNVTVPSGGVSGFAWVDLGGTVYGLGQSKEGGIVPIRFQGGYTPEPIGTHAITAAIQACPRSDLEAARAFAVEWQQHRFYVLSIPNQFTVAFDESTREWSHWTYWNTTTASADPFLGVTHVCAFGMHLIGSRQDGTLYAWSDAYLDDDGAAIRCVRRAPYLSDGPRRLRHKRLWFDVETGVGVESGDDADEQPVGMVRWSDDSVKTWSAEHHVSLGARGQYGQLAELWRLGLAGAKGRVYEYAVTADVVRTITDADVEAR